MLKKIALLPLVAILGFAVVPPAASALERRSDQAEARAQMMAGKVKSLREIEVRILPKMRGFEYLGPEYDPKARVYRLKFIRNSRVRFIDIDATSGRILDTR